MIAAISLAMAAIATTQWQAFLGFAVASLALALISPLSLTLLGQAVAASHRVFAVTRASAIAYSAYLIGPVAIGLASDTLSLTFAFLLVSATLLLIPFVFVPIVAIKLRHRSKY